MKKTQTSSFGTTKRESHDSSKFYSRELYGKFKNQTQIKPDLKIDFTAPGKWANQIYLASSEKMTNVPDNSIALAFTSPPYNVGKDYEDDISLDNYLKLIKNVGKEVYKKLKPGGRYCINIANLGRRPYIPMHSFFYEIHIESGFLPMGEIIWQKAKGANGSCAWGSWKSAKAPRLRDLHEYVLVFSKMTYSRPDKGISDISKDEFMKATLSVWEIPPESAKKVGHPAPFPVALAERIIRLYSYENDVILDPFVGSGTTCLAAAINNRKYVGYDISDAYCLLARERITNALKIKKD